MALPALNQFIHCPQNKIIFIIYGWGEVIGGITIFASFLRNWFLTLRNSKKIDGLKLSISILRIKIFFPLPFTAHPKQLRLTKTKMPKKQEKNVSPPCGSCSKIFVPVPFTNCSILFARKDYCTKGIFCSKGARFDMISIFYSLYHRTE